MLRANHPPGYNKQYNTLQKSCCLHCVIISPRRVQPQLTPEEDFGKKLKRRVKFKLKILTVKTRKCAIIIILEMFSESFQGCCHTLV